MKRLRHEGGRERLRDGRGGAVHRGEACDDGDQVEVRGDHAADRELRRTADEGGAHEQRPTGEPVGQRAPDEQERHVRRRPGGDDEAERGDGVGEVEHRERERHRGQPVAEAADRGAEREPSERREPQRGQRAVAGTHGAPGGCAHVLTVDRPAPAACLGSWSCP